MIFMAYKLIEDIATADVAFKAENKTLAGLFKDCAMAAADSMANTKKVKPKLKKKIKLKNENVEKLLFDFLGEIIFLKDKEGIVYNKFAVKIKKEKTKNKKETYFLESTAYCDRINQQSQGQELRNDVKAVTLHKFSVKKTKSSWNAMVILDI